MQKVEKQLEKLGIKDTHDKIESIQNYFRENLKKYKFDIDDPFLHNKNNRDLVFNVCLPDGKPIHNIIFKFEFLRDLNDLQKNMKKWALMETIANRIKNNDKVTVVRESRIE